MHGETVRHGQHVFRYTCVDLVNLMKRLNYFWRLFGTGFSFIVFGLGGLTLGVFVSPVISLFVRDLDRRQCIARRIIGSAFSAFIWLMATLGVLSYKVEGEKNVGRGYNQLVIANHPTLIDVVFLVSLFPMADCVIKEAVMKNPFMRGAVVPANYIASLDPGKLLDCCVGRLRSGGKLILFPEGTRSVYGQPLKFKMGAASIASRSEAEILPVIIQCTQPKLLAKNVPWYRVSEEKPFFSIRIQPPVTLKDMIPENLNFRDATYALNQSLLRLFEKSRFDQ